VLKHRHPFLRRRGHRKLKITVRSDDGRGNLNEHTLVPLGVDRDAWRLGGRVPRPVSFGTGGVEEPPGTTPTRRDENPAEILADPGGVLCVKILAR
jgi:hypothetical protein